MNRDFFYPYIKYRTKYLQLKSQVGGSFQLGKINSFEGNGGTRAIDIYQNNIKVGMVICNPFYLYGKFKNFGFSIDEELISRIEHDAYVKYIGI